MNKIKLLFCLLSFLLIPLMTHASEIQVMKTSLAEQHGKERHLLLEKYLKEIPADSLKTREGLIRFTLDQIEKDKNDLYKGRIYLKLVKLLLDESKINNALDTLFIAKEFIVLNNDSIGMGYYYSILGKYYYESTNYDRSMLFYDSSAHIFEQYDLFEDLASSYNGIGTNHFHKHDFYKAIKHYKKTEKIYLDINNKTGLYKIYGNLSLVYKNARMIDRALYYIEKSIKHEKEFNIKPNNTALYVRTGLYINMGRYLEAKKIIEPIYKKTILKIFGGKRISGTIIKNIKSDPEGNLYDLAVFGKRLSAIKNKLREKGVFSIMNVSYMAQTHLKNLELEERANVISSFRDKSKLEKKQLESELALSKEKEDNYRQRLLIFIILGIVLIISFSLLIYHRSNKKLQEKNNLIKKQQVNIIDSINYASRIQHSILLPERSIQKTLPGFFAYFKPRDIVSGDFYWYAVVDEIKIIAAIDCTGHGVPGAFMSMIGNTLLNEIVIEKCITDPGEILNHLHEAVITTLQQDKEGEHSQDGMDLSLCAINQKKKEVKFAGAKNPIYIIRDNKIDSIKGDPFSIGGMYRYLKKTKKEIKFITKTISTTEDLSIYMFSDGYMDQFGSKNKRTFNNKRFKKMLLDIHNNDPETQKNIISENMNEWKGNTKQLDDMLVIGFKV